MTDATIETDQAGACPKCGTALRVVSGRGAIDRPLEQCAGCGGFVIRPGASEWELLKPGEQFGHLARHAAIALAGGLVLAALVAAIGLSQRRGLQLRDVLLWFAAGCALAGLWAGSRLVSRIRRSRRRMRDPMYLAKLAEYEIAVGPRR